MSQVELGTGKESVKVKVQRFGGYLGGMILPNIGAFIAFGLITALFIPAGWIPNEDFALLVDPLIKYLLPILIGYTGGKMVYDVRGGVVGAIATMGVIVGASIPMFLGAMMMGPLGGYLVKKFDQLLHGKIKAGFEMLVNNFSAGIIGAGLAMIALKVIGPTVEWLNNLLATGVEFIIDAGVLPLANIFIEPAKVLFLNNAINHGILSPLGLEQASDAGKSILFLLETNPGPGLGILLAYWIFGRGSAKRTAPGAVIIHFLGGIHEIYFPYILMKPALLLAAIAGGISGVFTFSLFDSGLIAPPSPGSIFALMAMTPRGGHFAVLLGVIIAAAVSFLVASFILRRSKDNGSDDLSQATQKMEEMKGKKSSISSIITESQAVIPVQVKNIVFACDAGMGSSAMGASILRNKIKEAGLNIDVKNVAINNLTSDIDVVVTQKDLTNRAKAKLPNAYHVSVENFLNSPKYDELIEQLKSK